MDLYVGVKVRDVPTARKNNILFLLTKKPWWWSFCFSAGFYICFAFVGPMLLGSMNNPVANGLVEGMRMFSWVALLLLLPIPFTIYNSAKQRRRLDQQHNIESIRSLTWKAFEELLAEAYRRQGYKVRENLVSGPDGGVDLVITKGDDEYLVQCKQWKSKKVGVKVIREMYGLMHDRKVTGGIIVTSGMFTQEAKTFASDKPIDLIDESHLNEMIHQVQTDLPRREPSITTSNPQRCPKCGADLVRRTAKQGKHAGRPFFGCSGFPDCRYIAPIE